MTETLELVSLYREDFDETEWFGFVVGESEHFLAIHHVSDRYDLDGYRIFRLEDTTSIDEEFDRKSLVERAMEMKGLTPKLIPWLDLSSVRNAIHSIQENEPVVVIERERASPEECEVGRVRMDSDSTYSLLSMTTDATWEPDDRLFRYPEITQISFGGEYETTLAHLAGDPPRESDA